MDFFSFFSINTTMFTFWGYQMSYLEFVATILNLLCVWLVASKNIWTWPIGIVAVVLFAILFYQIQLYSDMLEQIYFIATGFYGWWIWLNLRKGKTAEKELKIAHTAKRETLIFISIVAVGSVTMGYLMNNIHVYLPKYFPEPASFPYLDAFTTVMSFTAQILMARKKIECWYLWILVDIIGIWLYWVKGVKFISLEYFIFLILASRGCYNWWKDYLSQRRASS